MCPCKTYDCRGGFQETCGFSEGFCSMLRRPAEYRINYIRVYQDKDDPKQKVGCSTKERPTRKFIEAHEKKYMQKGDVSLCIFESLSLLIRFVYGLLWHLAKKDDLLFLPSFVPSQHPRFTR